MRERASLRAIAKTLSQHRRARTSVVTSWRAKAFAHRQMLCVISAKGPKSAEDATQPAAHRREAQRPRPPMWRGTTTGKALATGKMSISAPALGEKWFSTRPPTPKFGSATRMQTKIWFSQGFLDMAGNFTTQRRFGRPGRANGIHCCCGRRDEARCWSAMRNKRRHRHASTKVHFFGSRIGDIPIHQPARTNSQEHERHSQEHEQLPSNGKVCWRQHRTRAANGPKLIRGAQPERQPQAKGGNP